MSSYIESLDRKEIIKKAKQRMNHFSDLYRLLCVGISVPGISYGGISVAGGSSVSHSKKILYEIEKKDERYAEIEEVLLAMERLDPCESEILFLKHIMMKNINQISNMIGKSKSPTYEVLNDAYFRIAVVLNLK
ncbi:hypothetical protein M2475_001626 [Breznakia sp. PF5-3]|uniref:hypothetical protein n=1 Tax=unclassified Breznakia TaxID=2623764 RepID=UPI0024074413|nr:MULTISPECIES: hypothetical protein [unclassified Breznakia]MDF9825192.1 hypothetical protein [Breznakia sp. PM6-1]MDF9836050.1 hypothetical protein [Breznakia sp. PF5-3]MDF9838866.1 hypothetical protein [Breznakia sp. PFB2-8]MDF9860892.1 hypothetical protein [Breznakia sp. PH5-24]